MAQQAVMLTRTYDETLDLIVETRDYLIDGGSRVAEAVGGLGQLQLSCEALRVTSRLTEALAWLMIQRAVSEGEISAVEACASRYRLSGHAVCLDTESAAAAPVPDKLRSLMQRSYRLYCRISRLEQMVVARMTESGAAAATRRLQ